MSEPTGQMTMDDLPGRIPVFPLAGCILLPRGRLPLNIFEPRYLAMCHDTLASHRMIGMVQPTNPEAGGARPELYRVGCAGRITSFTETDDERYLITLTGVCRFSIRDEPPASKSYRLAEVDYDAYAADLEPPRCCALDRATLVPTLKTYFEIHGLTADWDAVEKCPGPTLVTSLSMICPFAPSEKQALLESRNMDERVDLFLALLDMGIHEGACDDHKGPCH